MKNYGLGFIDFIEAFHILTPDSLAQIRVIAEKLGFEELIKPEEEIVEVEVPPKPEKWYFTGDPNNWEIGTMFYNGNDNWTITITFIKGEKFKITNNIQDDDHKSYGPENYTIDEDGDYTILFNSKNKKISITKNEYLPPKEEQLPQQKTHINELESVAETDPIEIKIDEYIEEIPFKYKEPPFISIIDNQKKRAKIIIAGTSFTDTGEIDVEKLINIMTENKPVTVLPYRKEKSLAHGFHILLDKSDRMMPYILDEFDLLTQFEEIIGIDYLKVFSFTGSPARRILSRETNEFCSYQLPPVGVPVILFSDLGVNNQLFSPHFSDTSEWINFFIQADTRGNNIIVFFPYAAHRCPIRFKKYITIMQWSKYNEEEIDYTIKIDQNKSALLPLLQLYKKNKGAVVLALISSLAIRVESELLRKLRISFAPSVNAGAEGDLWFSEIVQKRSSMAIIYKKEIADYLRYLLAGHKDFDIKKIYKAIKNFRVTTNAQKFIQAEEDLIYYSLVPEKSQEKYNNLNKKVLNTLLKSIDNKIDLEFTDVADWILRVFPRLPDKNKDTTLKKEIISISHFLSLDDGQILPGEHGLAQRILNNVRTQIKNYKREPIEISLTGDSLTLKHPAEKGTTLNVPATNPIIFFLESEKTTEKSALNHNSSRTIVWKEKPLIMRFLDGKRYKIEEKVRNDVLKIKVIPSYYGEAFIISYGIDTTITNILIDGGLPITYKKYLKTNLLGIFKNNQNLDLVIVTNINDSHIGGIIELFNDTEIDISLIKRIWYNSLNTTKSDLIIVDNDNTKIYQQGSYLEQILLNNENWNNTIIKAGNQYTIGDAIISILSPDEKTLEKYSNQQEKMILEDGTPAAKKKERWNSITEHASSPFKEDTSVFNINSISFIFEYSGKKILFLSNSVPSVICRSLRNMGYSTENKLKIDMLKVSHYGSKNNTSNELLALLECTTFLITSDGKRNKVSERKCLSRIITHNKNKDLPTTLLFSIDNKQTRNFLYKEELADYDVTVHYLPAYDYIVDCITGIKETEEPDDKQLLRKLESKLNRTLSSINKGNNEDSGYFFDSNNHNIQLNIISQGIENINTEVVRFKHLEILHLRGNNLVAVPENISNLENLGLLDLADNNFHSFPDPLLELDTLHSLDLSNNDISYIPNSIGLLKNLTMLDLGNNSLAVIPPELFDLEVKLKQDNEKKGLYLYGNPVKDPPLSVLENGINEIQRYYNIMKPVYSLLDKAVINIIGTEKGGTIIKASGFIIQAETDEYSYVVTAKHVVENININQIIVNRYFPGKEEKKLYVKQYYNSASYDISILICDYIDNVPMVMHSPPAIEDTVLCQGFIIPQVTRLLTSYRLEGFISSVDEDTFSITSYNTINSQTIKGMSGAAVIKLENNSPYLLGIVTGYNEGENNFTCLRISLAEMIIHDNSLHPFLASVTQEERITDTQKPLVFICYAREDNNPQENRKGWLDWLLTQIKRPLEKAGIELFIDNTVITGEYDPAIRAALSRATAAILLLSPDFMNSGYIIEKELPTILTHYKKGDLELFPVLISYCNWDILPIKYPDPDNYGKKADFLLSNLLLCGHDPENPIDSLAANKVDRVFTEVTKMILTYHAKLKNKLQKKEKAKNNSQGKSLPNPFITGRPIYPRNSELFVGREDIINEIQKEVLNQKSQGMLLLLGNRRIGKTSTLLNMKHHFTSAITPVYIDFMDPTINSNVKDFSLEMAQRISKTFKTIEKRIKSCTTLKDLTRSMKELQTHLEKNGKFILLCFDEYEWIIRPDNGLIELPETYRYWITNFRNIICLFAGTNRFDDIKGIDWNQYLNNVRVIPISFLDVDSALKLVTRPVPGYDIIYNPPNLAKNLVLRLGRHPFLIQTTMFELTEILNSKNSKTVTGEDIEAAIRELFISADNYFTFIMEGQLNPDEREIVTALAYNKIPETSMKSLVRKEILIKENDSYIFCIPVVQEWLLKIYLNN